MARRETPSQVASRALVQAQRRGAPYVLQKALIEAGIVESGLQHQKYERVGSGDRDSIGFLQQRPSAGWGGPQSIETDTNQFVDHGLALLKRGFKGSSGELAQAIQVSAFPGRYNQVSGRAASIIGRRGGADAPAGGGSADPGAGSLPAGAAPDLGSAQSLVPLLQALKSQPQARSSAGIAQPAFSAQAAMPGGYQSPVSGGGPAPPRDMNALLAAVQTLGGSVPSAQQQSSTGGSPDAAGANTGPASSGAFGKSHSPLLELIHNTGSGAGYAVKDGHRVNGPQFYSGVWAGHANHVHVAAGPKTVVQLGRLAQQMGLHVGENPHFGGVSPVHAKNSYHYRGEAIDVSGDPRKMNAYAQRVERLYGLG